MSVIFIVFPLALIVAACAVAAFAWAARDGQFDDLDSPAIRVLQDDDPGRPLASSRAPAGEGRHPVTPDRRSADPRPNARRNAS